MNIYSKTVEGGKINPSDFANRESKMKAGDTYPDLYSQASYVMKDVERISNKIIKEADDLYHSAGYESVGIIMDSMYHYIVNEIVLSEGDSEYFTKEIMNGIANEIYQRILMAKSIMEIFQCYNILQDKDAVVKLTKQDIKL